MKRITIGKKRKDNKFPVTYWYEGAPNAFGGRYAPTVYRKLHTVKQINSHHLFEGDELINDSGMPDDHFNLKKFF